MEKGEVTDKVRNSIKKKLIEINAFVDDELPEYIMILVANKRSKAQIEKDLALFLGDDTSGFTNWLWNLLANVKSDSKILHSLIEKGNSTNSKRKDFDDVEADVLNYDPDEPYRDSVSPENNIEKAGSKIAVKHADSQTKVIVEDLKSSSLMKVRPSSVEKIADKDHKRKVGQKSAKVYPVQISRTLPSSNVSAGTEQSIINSTAEYDPAKPDYVGSVSSVVCVTQRKYGGAAALQANKLLLKAVDDATKSVLDGKSLIDLYKPTPLKDSSFKGNKNVIKNEPQNVKAEPGLNSNTNLRETEKIVYEEVMSNNNLADFLDDNFNDFEQSHNSRTICLKTVPITSDSDIEELKLKDEYFTSHSPVDERSRSPHFFVTLHGAENYLKRKRMEGSVENMDCEEEESLLEDIDDDDAPAKKQKIIEKCKYWPACKNSDQCFYHHPTVPCKCFPDCKYGDKCLFIHPKCKFDALCSRKDCPYTHTKKRKLPLSAIPVKMMSVKRQKVKTVCKFYPKCTSKKCPFIHPKPCRYGINCRAPKCLYSHFHVPPPEQLKWKANLS